MPPRLSKFVLGSVTGHAALAALGLWFASGHKPLALVTRPTQTVELEFTAPPRAEAQPPLQAPAQQPPHAQQPEPRPAVSARTISNPRVQPVAPEPQSAGSADPNPQTAGTNTGNTGAVEPQNTGTPTVSQPSGRILSAVGAGLIPTGDNYESSANAARLGGVAIPAGDGNRAERRASIFGPSRRCTGTPEECARQVAMAPITEALGSQQRPMPAGTGAHGRQVASRASESFLPVRQIPNVGSIVASRGVTVSPTVTREPSAGERGHNSEFNARTGIDMGSGTVTIPQPSYRMVRAEIEVDQDPEGAITGTRVASTSRSDVFDRAAERAIREALSEADPFRTAARRRSRWAFEVSEAEPPGRIDRMIRGGGNEGWTVSRETSNGMHIRYRVRMVSMRVLSDPAQGASAPGVAGRSG